MKRYSRRDEIAAAWAFCGMLALAAWFDEIGSARDDSLLMADHRGQRGADGAGMLDSERDEGRGDRPTTNLPNYAAPVVTAAAKLSRGEPPRTPTRDGRSCWDMFRRSRSG